MFLNLVDVKGGVHEAYPAALINHHYINHSQKKSPSLGDSKPSQQRTQFLNSNKIYIVIINSNKIYPYKR